MTGRKASRITSTLFFFCSCDDSLTHWPLGDVVVILKSNLWTHVVDKVHRHFLWNCSQLNATEHFDDKPTLAQVMAIDTVRQREISWANVDPDPGHHMASIDHNVLRHINHLRSETKRPSRRLPSCRWVRWRQSWWISRQWAERPLLFLQHSIHMLVMLGFLVWYPISG